MSAAFAELGVCPEILGVVDKLGYGQPTPIQAGAIPEVLRGADVLGIAQTGTGKTAAFAIPILQTLRKNRERPRPGHPQALVLAPTRELAMQIHENCERYGDALRLRSAMVCGGVNQRPQVAALQSELHILIATPGRLLDLMNQGHCKFVDLKFLVIDEADRMLDMGFLPDVRRILRKVPRKRQTLLFSATMPDDVVDLADRFLSEPVRVEVAPQSSVAERVEQKIYHVRKSKKRDALVRLLRNPSFERTLVFARTKHGADHIVRHLLDEKIPAYAIHANKTQSFRERALREFREGQVAVLVATDIAARGIDVPEITHVINFDLPNQAETYVHRIGRTARAERTGVAISFCDEFESEHLRAIQDLLRKKIPTMRAQDLTEVPPEGEAVAGKKPTKMPVPFERINVLEEEAEAKAARRTRRPSADKRSKDGSDEPRRRRGEVRPGGRRAAGKGAKEKGQKGRGPNGKAAGGKAGGGKASRGRTSGEKASGRGTGKAAKGRSKPGGGRRP